MSILAVTRTTQNVFLDYFRTIIWQFCLGVLSMLEGLFNIINKIWQFKFFDIPYVNKIFSGSIIVASSFLILKVIIELILHYIVKGDAKDSPLVVYRGIVLAIVMMFLITPLFEFGHKFSTEMTKAVISVSNMNSSSKVEKGISTTLIKSMVDEEKMKKDDLKYFVENWKTIDINDSEYDLDKGKKVYKYGVNYFMLIVLAVLVVFLLLFVAIQMAKRVMEIALYKILGPFCCTSLTTNDARSFSTWFKSAMGVFLITIVQFVSIGLLMNMFINSFDVGSITSIFLIIGALLFIIGTPTLVSALLSEQSGVASGLGDMYTLMGVSHGLSTGYNVAKSAVGGAFTRASKLSNIMGDGVSKVVNNKMHKSSLSKEQMDNVKDSMNKHNGWRAQQQIKEYLNANQNRKNSRNNSSTHNNNFNNMGFRYNTKRNQFMNKGSDKK